MVLCRLGATRVAACVGRCVPAAAFSSAAPAPKARIALAGAGWWAQGWHLPHMAKHPDCEVAAIVDPSAETAHWQGQGDHWSGSSFDTLDGLGAQYGCPTFATIDELLSSDVAVDGVLVSSNHATHAEIGLKAIAAGLNIMMEKPMTTDVGEAKQLLTAAQQAGTIFMVNNTANWRPSSKLAYELMRAGEVGEVKHVNCYMGSPLASLFEDPKAGGWVKPTGTAGMNGFGWGQLSHTLAWVYQVSGLTPVKVFAFMGLSESSGADIYDSGTVLCSNGATISVAGVATIPMQATVPGDVTTATKQIDNRIFGTDGMLIYSGLDLAPESGRLELRKHDGTEKIVDGFCFENYDVHANDGTGPESLHAFIDGCRGRPFFNGASGEVGLKVVQTVDAMYLSAKTGQAVDVASLG